MNANPAWFEDQDQGWEAYAECGRAVRSGAASMNDWFPPKGSSARRDKATARAFSICRQCPVQQVCLNNNLDVPDGIFGGKTPKERAEIRKKSFKRAGSGGGPYRS